MKFTTAALTVLLCCIAIPQSAGAQAISKIFSQADIYGLSVEGFKLTMSQDDATKILAKNKWEGQWRDYVGPEVGYPFKRGGEMMYLMRYRAKNNQLYIWSIVHKKGFDRPDGNNMPVNHVLGQVWIDSIISHYGQPSVDFINPNGVNAYVYYLTNPNDEDRAKLEIYLSRSEVTFELTDRKILSRTSQ